MQRVATCLMFWQLAGVRHLSPAPRAGVLCQPPNSPPPPTVRPRPQLENSGLYNTAFTIIGPYYSCLCLAPSVFLGVSGSKGNSDGKGRGTVAQTRTKPCISGIPGELSSRYAVKDTHEEFFFSLHMPEKCRGTPVSLSAENMWQLRHSVWIQCTIQPSVETCHWVMGPSSRSHRYVLKHVGEELCWFHSRGGPRLGVCLCSPLLGNSGDAAIKTSHNCTAIGRNIAITVGWGIRQ